VSEYKHEPLKEIFRMPEPGEESEDGVKEDRAIDDGEKKPEDDGDK